MAPYLKPFLIVVAAALLFLAPRLLFGINPQSLPAAALNAAIAMGVIGLTVAAARLRWGNAAHALSLSGWPEEGRRALAAVSIGLTAALLLSFAAKQTALAFTPQQAMQSIQGLGWPSLWINILIWVALAPLAEELFFRGFLFRIFEDRGRGPWVAAAVTTTLWVLIHAGRPWPMLVALAPIGGILFLLRQKTRSLLVPLAVHSLFNTYNALLVLFVAYLSAAA